MIIDPRIENILDHLNILEIFDEFEVDYLMDGKNIGVNYAQGYGIHKPCSFDEVFKSAS